MALSVGIDIGSTTLKIAGIDENKNLRPVMVKYLLSDRPLYEMLIDSTKEYTDMWGSADYIGITGSGQKLGAYILATNCTATEIIAHAKGSVFLAEKLHLPPPQTIVEIGGQDSKLIVLKDGIPVFFNMNSICSAGTGEFLRHTIEELSLDFSEFNSLVLEAKEKEALEDTCTVFARRSFRHAGQNGVALDKRLKGLAEAILKNYLRTVAKNQSFAAPVFFLGGLSKCSAMAKTLSELIEQPVFVPPLSQGVGAIGMACLAYEKKEKIGLIPNKESFHIEAKYCQGCINHCELVVVSTIDNQYFLGGRCESAGRAGLSSVATNNVPSIPKKKQSQSLRFCLPDNNGWAIGLDAGSRQLKAALLYNRELIYLHTETTLADILSQSKKVLHLLKSYMPKNTPFSLGTTGSGGRYLSLMLSGNEDLYQTEILCHYRSASQIFSPVGSVIDVGGNDSKIIIAGSSSLDFAMNDRCAAGTGSFLEQLAKRFNLSLEEAAFLALKSEKPARLGSRCAVLAETDIIHKMRSGAKTEDLLLGACYALARTFIADTLHGKTLITPVVFQGGAFLNPALLLAFIEMLALEEDEYYIAKDKRFLVGAGAIGTAMYALENNGASLIDLSFHYSQVGGIS